MSVEALITEHLDLWTASIQRSNATGRGSNKKIELYGVKKLRELILELAVRGRLVPQDAGDEPAAVLLERIAAEKARLVKEKKIKKQKVLPPIGEDEKPFDLPEGWAWCRLGDVYDVRDGTHGSPKPQLTGFPLVTSKNLSSGSLDLSNVKYISEDDHNKIIERSAVSFSDILFAMIGNIGNPVIVDIEPNFSIKNVALFKYYNKEVCPEYLKYFLSAAARHIRKSSAGGVQPFVSLGKLRAYVMPSPPEAEQRRIVIKINELMQLCDQLEQATEDNLSAHETLVSCLLDTITQSQNANDLAENWQILSQHFDTLFTTEASIDQLKQTILQLAVMGKLVPQDPNDEPASVLLERIAVEKVRLLKEKKIKKQKVLPEITEGEKPFELPVGWAWCRLSDVLDVRDGTHDSPENATGVDTDTFPLVTSKDFKNGQIDFDGARRISRDDYVEISKRSMVEVGDILFSMIGGNIGNQVQVIDSRPFSIKNVALLKYFNKQLTLPSYIKIYTENLAMNLQSKASGGAQPFISLGALRGLIFALPPASEQLEITQKSRELMKLCDQLKANLTQAQQTQLQLTNILVEL